MYWFWRVPLPARTAPMVLCALACALLLGLIAAPAQAQPKDPWRAFSQPQFTRIGTDQGLPANGIFSLAQDADGYLWIGSAQGLSRYDGQHFHTITPQVDRPGGLPDGYVRALQVLPDGRLLVGTNSGGLAVFDPRQMRFSRIPLGRAQSTNVRVLALRPAADGGVWAASDLGLDHYDPATNRTRPLTLDGLPSNRTPRVFDVVEDANRALWIGTAHGLYRRRAGQSRFQQVAAETLGPVLVWSLHLDRRGQLWVGTDNRGVVVIGADGKIRTLPGLDPLIGRQTVRGFLETADGRLWISTYGSGLIECPALTCRHPRAIRHARGNPHTVASNAIRAMLLDRSGALWLGTTHGLSRTLPTGSALQVVSGSATQAPALMNQTVTAILVDRQQRVWLGLGNAGVEVLDLRHGRSQHITLPGDQARQIISSLAQTEDGTIWIGSLGVLGLDPETFQPVARIAPLADLRITALSAEPGQLVIGTFRGAYRHDLQRHTLHRIGPRAGDGATNTLNEPNWIVRTDGARWYATIHGLGRQRLGQPAIDLLRHRTDDATSLPQDYLSMLAWDRTRQRLWAATKGGLAWAHIEPGTGADTPTFHSIQVQGQTQRVSAVALDRAGNAWATGDNRLLRVDADSLQALSLSRHDGLPAGSFQWRAAAQGPHGEILLGGSFGLLIVRPEQLAHAAPTTLPAAQLRISELRINGVLEPLGHTPDAAITLAADQRDLSAIFSLLDYRAPQAISYRYRLAGFEQAWHAVPPGVPARLTYTNLPTGHYRLQLRARIGGLQAQTISNDYTLRVLPRWYETWPARVLELIVLLGVALALVYAGLAWSRHRQRVLDRLVRQRTQALRHANTKLERLASTDELTGLATRHALMELADRMLANAITHDQPLAVLLIDLDEFKKINDTHGHLAGDAVLRATAHAIFNACRVLDVVGRYGGEEITVCMPDSDAIAASQLAQRIRAAVAAQTIPHGDQQLTLTCSIGVAIRRPTDRTLSALLSRADKALYRAKDNGRNRVESDSSAPD